MSTHARAREAPTQVQAATEGQARIAHVGSTSAARGLGAFSILQSSALKKMTSAIAVIQAALGAVCGHL